MPARKEDTYITWQMDGSPDQFVSLDEGWTLTRWEGMRPEPGYDVTSLAGADGSALGIGKIPGLEPSFTLQFGDPDPAVVAKKVAGLKKGMRIGGRPSMHLRVLPHGFEGFYTLRVACRGPQVTYSHQGKIVEVTVGFVSYSPSWAYQGAAPEEEGMEPW